MTYESTTTLKLIRDAWPCKESWAELLKHLGKTKADDEPLSLLTVLDSNGLDDALWVLSNAMPDDRLARHFQAWCAEQVLHIFEAKHPNDTRVRDQIAMLRNDDATDEERQAARRAARAAVRAAWAVADQAAAPAQWYAGMAAAEASEAAGGRAVWHAACNATRAIARFTARVTAWDAQERQLRAMIGEPA